MSYLYYLPAIIPLVFMLGHYFGWHSQLDKVKKKEKQLELMDGQVEYWQDNHDKAATQYERYCKESERLAKECIGLEKQLEFTKGQTELLAKVTIEIRETQKKLRHAEKIIRSYYFGVLNKEILDNLVQKHFGKDINES
jgi:hypothetical protein